MPCRPTSPDTSTTSPGDTRSGRRSTPGGIRPMPDVVMKMPSPLPRSTTLVSPVTSATPHAAAVSRIERTTRSSSACGSPSSSTKAAARNAVVAPAMARSLIVPQTASLPMSPPGKNRGLTTKESVVRATRSAPMVTTALSCGAGASADEKARRKTDATRSCADRPPPPWASWIVSDANGRGHAGSIPSPREAGRGSGRGVRGARRRRLHEAPGRVRR